MRKVYRDTDACAYWDNRWMQLEKDASSFQNLTIYPIKQTEAVINKDKYILDAGCGLGRVVKHYHNQGYRIVGSDYSEVAINKLKESNKELNIYKADITKLPFSRNTFDIILALGVLHSIPSLKDIYHAMNEVYRCLKIGGIFVVSVRADNLENRLIDFISNRQGKKGKYFHKWCFEQDRIEWMLSEYGFYTIKSELAVNVPFLHKFKIFRRYKYFNEKTARSWGYELNGLGNFIYKSLRYLFPKSFGTIIVVTAQKT